MLRLKELINYDTNNGPGMRLSIWFSGCTNHCPGCWAKDTWDYYHGVPLRDKIPDINALMDVNDGVSLLGGDPLCCVFNHPEDVGELVRLLEDIKARDKSIWVWTGYTVNELYTIPTSIFNQIFGNIDYLVVGRFIQEKRDLTLKWRGSSNQRIVRSSPVTKDKAFRNHIFLDVTDKCDNGELDWE